MGPPQPAVKVREKRVRGSTPKTLARRRVAVALAPPSFSEGARGLPGQAPPRSGSRGAVVALSERPSLEQAPFCRFDRWAAVPWRALLPFGARPPQVSGLRGLAHRGPSMRWARRPCSCLPGRCQGELAPAGGGRTPPGVAATPGFVPGRGDERRASLGAAGLQKESGRFASQRRRAVARSRRRAPCNKWEL